METAIDRLFRHLAGMDQSGMLGGAETCTPGSVCGYTLTIGADGRPVLNEFGTGSAEGTPESGAREPLVDTIINDKERTAKLVAEMPGVERSDVDVTVNNKNVVIAAERGDKKYSLSVPLRHRVAADSAKASYKNGILEVTFQLLGEPKPKGRKVEVQ